MATIAVALSGGVDSAVSALLLADQGHEVMGVTMRLWQESPEAGDPTAEARRVAETLDIPFHVIDAVVALFDFGGRLHSMCFFDFNSPVLAGIFGYIQSHNHIWIYALADPRPCSPHQHIL